MADLLLQQKFLNDIDDYQANNGKYEIEGQVIFPYKIDLKCRLDEMREVLDRNGSQT